MGICVHTLESSNLDVVWVVKLVQILFSRAIKSTIDKEKLKTQTQLTIKLLLRSSFEEFFIVLLNHSITKVSEGKLPET
jgi:hypothetical protein